MQKVDLKKRYLVIAREGTFGTFDSEETSNPFNDETDFPIASADELGEALVYLLEAKLESQEFEMVVLDQEKRHITRPRKLVLTDREICKVLNNCPEKKETGLTPIISDPDQLN
jgi:hypothetical protein